jgi:hypothetical protein
MTASKFAHEGWTRTSRKNSRVQKWVLDPLEGCAWQGLVYGNEKDRWFWTAIWPGVVMINGTEDDPQRAREVTEDVCSGTPHRLSKRR